MAYRALISYSPHTLAHSRKYPLVLYSFLSYQPWSYLKALHLLFPSRGMLFPRHLHGFSSFSAHHSSELFPCSKLQPTSVHNTHSPCSCFVFLHSNYHHLMYRQISYVTFFYLSQLECKLLNNTHFFLFCFNHPIFLVPWTFPGICKVINKSLLTGYITYIAPSLDSQHWSFQHSVRDFA